MTTVDRKQLIALLAERTGMDRSRVDRQLSELIDHIRQAEAGRDAFEIERFGRFRIAGQRLEFVPSDILSTEINNKYAGMKPIELMGAFQEPDGKDIPVADRPEEPQTVPKPEIPSEEQEEPVVMGSDSPGEPVTEPDPADAPDGRAGEKPPAVRQEEAQPKAERPREAPEASSPAAAVAAEAGESGSASESLADDPLGKAVVIVAIILTLAVAGWLAYDLGLFGSDAADTGSPSPSESPAEQQNAALPSQNLSEGATVELAEEKKHDTLLILFNRLSDERNIHS